MNKGLLIVVSGPSGCGKGSILSEIVKNDSIFYSVSATTRPPREGEIDGVHYHFISKETFEESIAENGMLEYATYCENFYGTPKKKVEDMLNSGKDVILEIEVNGAMKIKESCPHAVFIFILPPSIKELRRRLNKRGTETDEIVEKRINEATREILLAEEYDYIMINGDLNEAILEFSSILIAEKATSKRSKNKIEEVLCNA